jgi:uncharacterized protein
MNADPAAPGTVSAGAPRSFLLLHGWQNRRPEGHWHRVLAGELTALGHHVVYPQLPEPDEPDLGTWLDRLHAHLKELAEGPGERVVVGHSLSVLLWLHAVARGGVRADRVLLAAPPSPGVVAGIDEVVGFGGPAATAAGLRAAAPGGTRLVAGDNDPYCPGGADRYYGRPLGIDTDIVPGGGHLDILAGYGAWPSVLRWCLDPSVRLVGNDPRPE